MIFQKTNAGQVTPFWNTGKQNQIDQVNIDVSSIRAYSSEIEKGVSQTDAMAMTMSNASASAKEFATANDFSRTAVNGFRRSQEGAIKSVKGYSVALNGLKSIAKTVGMAFVNMGLTMVASFAISKAIEVIDQLIRKDEIAIEKANELADAWQKSSESLASNKKTLDGVSAEYTKLSKGVDTFGNNVSLTSDEYSRYNDLANQIAGLFPDLVSGWTSEGNAILKVKGNIDELNTAYEQARTNMNDTIINQAPEAVSGAYLQLFGKGSLFNTKTSGTQDRIKIIDEIVKQLKANKTAGGFDFVDVASLNEVLSGANIKDSINVESKAQDNIKNLELYKRTLENTALAQTSVYKNAAKAYLENTKEFKTMSDESKAMASTIITSLSPAMFEQFGSDYAQLAKWVQANIVDSLGSLDLSGIIETKSLFDTSKISTSEYESAFAEFASKISNLAPEVQEALNEAFSPDVSTLVENIKGKLSDAYDSMVGSLTLDQLNVAANLQIDDGVLWSWDELIAKIKETQTTAALSLESLAPSIKTLSEMYTVLDSAISEQAESGAMTYETYTKLIAANGDFADSISMVDGRLQINADKAYEVADAYTKLRQAEAEAGAASVQKDLDKNAESLEEINRLILSIGEDGGVGGKLYDGLIDQREELEGQRDALEDSLRGYQAITAEIEAMYGAYLRFKKAQQTPNPGTVYDAGAGDMKDTLKGGINSKALNTDEVKSAIDFFVGEGDESQAGLKKRSKAAKKIADRYFTEKDPLKGLNNFQDDLLNKKKMGDLAGSITKGKDGKIQIADGVEAQDIADQLGMSLEAVKSMFDKWKEYDADAEWDSLYEKLYPKETETPTEEQKTPIQTATEKLEQDLLNLEQKKQSAVDRIKAVQDAIKAALNGDDPPPTDPTPPTPGTVGRDGGAGGAGPKATHGGGGGDFSQTVTLTLALAEGELERISGEISTATGAVEVTTDTTQVTQALALLGLDIEKIPDGTVTITLDDPNGALASISSLSEAMEAIRQGAGATVTITLPEGTTQEELDALNASIAELPPEVQSKITVDTSTVAGAVESANTELDKVQDKQSKITADESSVAGSVTTANTELGNVKDKKAVIDADTSFIAGDVAKANEELGKVEDEESQISANGSTVPDTVSQANAELSKLQDKTVTVTIIRKDGGGGKFGDPTPPTSTSDVGGGAFKGKGGTSGSGGGRKSTSSSQPVEPINVDNIENAQAQMTIFEAIWLRIKALFPGQDAPLVDTVVSPAAQTEITNAQSGLDGLASTTIPAKTITLDDDQAYTDNTALEDRLDDTVTKKVKIEYEGGGGGFAKGTEHAPGGTSLVDEKGAELIEHKDGTYELGSNNGPRFTQLDKGDVVHTADETKKILRRGIAPKLSVGNRFASGTLPSPVGGSDRTSNTSSQKKNTKNVDWKKYVEKLFDWIEIRLKRLQEITDKWSRQIDRAVGSINKNKAIDSAISSISAQIAALNEAASRYEEQAAMVKKKTGLSQNIINAIQNGTLNISSYGSDTQKKIQEYMQWYEKAKEAREEIENLKDRQEELNHQKMDNIIKQYDDMVRAIESVREKTEANIDKKRSEGKEITAADYAPAVNAQKQKIAVLQEEYSRLKAEFDKQVREGTLVAGSDAYNEYLEQLADIDVEVINATTDLNEMNNEIKQIAVTNLNGLLTALQTAQNVIQGTLDLISAQGRIATTDLYKQLIANGMQQIANLQQTNGLLQQQQVGLDRNSDRYREIQEQIDSNLESINAAKVSQEEWNDSILDLRIDELTRMKDALSEANDEYERQRDLQQAIEDLERAKSQRKVRILENGEFKYVADVKAVGDAQRNLDQKLHDQSMNKIDKVIDAIEDLKSINNVYAGQGLSPTTLNELFPGAKLDEILAGVLESAKAGYSLSELAQSMNNTASALIQNTSNSNKTTITVSPNAIQIITNESDPEKIADYAIKKLGSELNMAFIQAETQK